MFAMKILKNVKEEFFFATYHVDKLITSYLIEKLGIDSIESMYSLGLKGRSKFEDRLDLLMQLKTLSTDKKKKLEIFNEIYNVILLRKETPYAKTDEYFSFLVKNYPQKQNLDSSEKASNILKDFVIDVQLMIKNMTSTPSVKTRKRKLTAVGVA